MTSYEMKTEKEKEIRKVINTVFYTCKHDSIHSITIEIVRLLSAIGFRPSIIEKDNTHSVIRIHGRNYRILKYINNYGYMCNGYLID